MSTSRPISAQVLTADLEVRLVPNVGATWQTVSLENSYSAAVVVCTYNLPSSSAPSAIPRVRNITASSFDVRIQQFENSSIVTASDVHCMIADEGAYNLPGGLKFEARSVLSDRTSGNTVTNGWNEVNLEDVTAAVTQSYSAPVVLGQVMSFNDVNASAFWTNNCTNRNRSPFDTNGRICVGKHIGQISGTRLSETLGFIVAESGSGIVNDMRYTLAIGTDTVAGVGNSPPYNYSLSHDFDLGIATQAGEDGGQGSWAVLYGADPLPSGTLQLAVDEETVAGDVGRSHTNEQIFYWVFKDEQSVTIDAQKDVAMSALSVSPYAIPGSDIIYTITVDNLGAGSVDNNSVFIADALPAQTIFYNGPLDGAGGPVVVFTDAGSGLSFDPSTDLGFSNGASKPANFAACSYSPAAGYDPAVTYICFNPKGRFRGGSVTASGFSIDFRVAVD